MSEIQILIVFFAFLFAGSLFYSAKSKNDTLFSFINNLELEYVAVGVVIYFLAGAKPVPPAILDGLLHLLLAFLGLALGTHFSLKLLKDVPAGFYTLTGLVYFAMLPLLYMVFRLIGYPHPLLMSIAFNTLMPYSINLSMKLFRISQQRVFVSSLTASLFPLFTLTAYVVAAGAVDYRPVDFFSAAIAAFLMSVVFLHYGQSKSKKNVHSLSILFVVLVAGIGIYFGISPLVLGFITGLLKSDTKYGNIFQNISINFERILYIFFYVALGIMVGFGFVLDANVFVTAGAVYLCYVLVRYFLAKFLAHRLTPAKDEVVVLISTGILPAVILLDFGTRYGFAEVTNMIMPFFILHIAAEITTYYMMRNERKND